MNVLQDLRAAYENGELSWHQGSFYDSGGTSACLLAGMGEMSGCSLIGSMVDGHLKKARSCLEQVIGEQYGPMGIVSFNDAPGRTLDEVTRVLDKAGVLLDEVTA